jgi:hypothetical protein
MESQVSSDRPVVPPSEVVSADAPSGSAGGKDAAVAPVWLQRLSLLVLVLFCVYLGVLVAVIPWWTRVWDHNLWIQSHPALAALLHNGAVRGFISGLGLLDIWIGVSEAVHYRDHRP